MTYLDDREWREYREMIALIEARPENQSGTDKTWVEETVRASDEHFARARRSSQWIERG